MILVQTDVSLPVKNSMAVRRAAAVVTSDRGDIEQLAGAARRRIQIIDV